MDSAFNKTLSPPFDAYANSVNYMLASYAIPYVGLTGYTGAAPLLQSAGAKSVNTCNLFHSLLTFCEVYFELLNSTVNSSHRSEALGCDM